METIHLTETIRPMETILHMVGIVIKVVQRSVEALPMAVARLTVEVHLMAEIHPMAEIRPVVEIHPMAATRLMAETLRMVDQTTEEAVVPMVVTLHMVRALLVVSEDRVVLSTPF